MENRTIKGDAAFIQRILRKEFDYYDGPGMPLDIEVIDGKVVSVWYGCIALPFRQVGVSVERAVEMANMKINFDIHGIGIKEK